MWKRIIHADDYVEIRLWHNTQVANVSSERMNIQPPLQSFSLYPSHDARAAIACCHFESQFG